MGKVAKAKKREPTVHSRAHRRNASPPPKDLAVKAPAAEEETEYKPWLHNAQNAGISKKKKVKPLKRQQKVRQQKALEKADANLDKLATKVNQSKARGRKVQARRVEWEELNGGTVVAEAAKVSAEDGEEDEDEAEEGGKEIELDEGMAEAGADAEAKATEGADGGVQDATVALPQPEEDEEL